MHMMADRVRMLRQQRGWSQEELGDVSGVDRRTVQRIEAGGSVSLETVSALANALGVDISRLRFGFSEERLREFEDAFLCPHCSSPLVARQPVEHEYGDAEIEEFSCGYVRGWRERPCPMDPRFPSF